MATINDFKTKIGTGLIRPNQFIVTIQFPNIPGIDAGKAATESQFMCRAASLPSSTVAPIPVYYRGRAINVAGERQFQPWTVAIYNEDFSIRNSLVKWSNYINNINDNTGQIQPASYKMKVTVEQLDRNGTKIKGIFLEGAFPIEISAIELDWENNAQIEMFQCTFVYDWYHDSGVNPDLKAKNG